MISIIKYIFTAVLIFGIFRIVIKILPQLSIRKKFKEIVGRFLPLFEFLFWLIFVFWILRSEIKEPFYLTSVMVGISALLLILIGFFVMKDYAAGLILKTEYGLQKGDTIATEKIRGKISKLGFLFVELETGESERIKIPYGKIGGQEIKTSNENSAFQKFSYSVSVEKSEKLSEIKQKLKVKLLNSPFSSTIKTPEITLLTEDSDVFNLSVSFYCRNEEYALKMKELIA
jgi:small-conductance mechanosensitive channel